MSSKNTIDLQSKSSEFSSDHTAPAFTDVFCQGDGEVHTFRIPSLITSLQGTLLAFAEARESRSDISKNDLVLKRSIDGGSTWLPMQTILSQKPDSINNPCAVVLPDSGRILVFVQRYPYPSSERSVKPGYDHPLALRNLLLWSDDDGLTWSPPRDITEQTKAPTIANSNAFGPGCGIVLQNSQYKGRIVVPVNQGPWGKWENYMILSDDNGQTWRRGQYVPRKASRWGGNEVQVAENPDGTLILNTRSWGSTGWFKPKCRLQSFSTDGGETWTPFVRVPELIEPRCMGSIISYPHPIGNARSALLFTNPASTLVRQKGTLRISLDGGRSWSQGKLLFPGNFAYSSLTVLKDGSVGCLFETGKLHGYEKLVFARIPPAWLL
jgi:sialidase-1